MQLFYLEHIEGSTVAIQGEEAQHLIKVLRTKPGDYIHVTDGKGRRVKLLIDSVHRGLCNATVIETILEERDHSLPHLVVAPTKNADRLEWLLEKSTEIGISRITPVICNHSERRTLNSERLKKIAVSAMKQSGRLWLPQIDPLTSFADFLTEDFEGSYCIAHCHDSQKHDLSQLCKSNQRIKGILIGPEGDFSHEEVQLAISKGLIPAKLGAARLRTETAALVAVTMLNYYLS